jgi:hypothetical protein
MEVGDMSTRMKSIALCISFLMCFSVVAPALAYDDIDDDDSGCMVLDTMIVRPFGLAAIVIGTAFFVISLPFTVPSGSVGKAADNLVSDPVKWTFCRPLGEWPETGGPAEYGR